MLQQACPNLPAHLWAIIAGHALAAADGPVAVLKTAATLLAVSHDVSLSELLIHLMVHRSAATKVNTKHPTTPTQVAAAVRGVPLRLDFQAAPEADVRLLPPLAATLSLHTLLLSADHASGEALLRSPAISARSGSSLRRLAATAACTDTLRRFPGLQELHLHAGAVEWLYPGGRDGNIPTPTFQPAEGTFQEMQS